MQKPNGSHAPIPGRAQASPIDMAQVAKVIDEFRAEVLKRLREGRQPVAMTLVLSEQEPDQTLFRFATMADIRIPGAPEGHYAALVGTRDLTAALVSMDTNYGLGQKLPFGFAAVAHPLSRVMVLPLPVSVQEQPAEETTPEGSRVVRELVEDSGHGSSGAG